MRCTGFRLVAFNAPVHSLCYVALPSFPLFFWACPEPPILSMKILGPSWARFNSLGHSPEAPFYGLQLSCTRFGLFLSPFLLFSWDSQWRLFSPPFLNCRWSCLCRLPHLKIFCRDLIFWSLSQIGWDMGLVGPLVPFSLSLLGFLGWVWGFIR